MADDLDPVEIQKKIEKLKNSDFKQQTLRSLRLGWTRERTCVWYGLFTFLFLFIGI